MTGNKAVAGQGSHASHNKGRRLNELTKGKLKNLVIPILFLDHQSRDLPTKEDISMLWNAPRGHPVHHTATNQSIRDFYLENSYGQLDINSTVIDWVEVSKTEAYYAAGESGGAAELMELLHEVLNTVDSLLDFSEFDENNDGYIDAIAFVHSGFGAEYGGYDEDDTFYTSRIWSHKWTIFSPSTWQYHPWESDEGVMVGDYHMETILNGVSGSTISTIAVGAHETGHFLGLPDLYDTDGSSSGIDTWGVMANSWGWDYTGDVPPSFSVWSKYVLGWISPFNLSQPGTYELNDIESNAEAFIISLPYADGEYLLIENRQPILADRQMPDGGLLIWHIDEMANSENNFEGFYGQSLWPENGYHYMVAVLQADGEFDLEQGYGADEGDIFSGSTDILHNSYSSHPSSLGYQYGIVTPAGFVIQNVSKGDGGVMSFTYAIDDSFSVNATGFECNDLLSVDMYDSWGDGWQGTVFQLFETPSFKAIQEVTLLDGSYDETCLNVKKDSCYYFEASMVGSWEPEVSWSICDSTGGVDDSLSFCLDINGTCYEADICAEYLPLYMYDTWGDGWNGATFDLYLLDSNTSLQTVTLLSGSEGVTCLMVDEGSCYRFESSLSGSYPSEVMFDLCDNVGIYGEHLDFCIDDNGDCFIPDECDGGSILLSQYDSYGDGWNGGEFSLYSAEITDDVVQSVGLQSGWHDDICLSTAVDSCYIFSMSHVGGWPSEISWGLCGITGYHDTQLSFCVDSGGACSNVSAETTEIQGEYSSWSWSSWSWSSWWYTTDYSWSSSWWYTYSSWDDYSDDCNSDLMLTAYDQYGDGWNGNAFALYLISNGNQSLVQTVEMLDGSYDYMCLNVTLEACYRLSHSKTGSWPSEVSYSLCGHMGSVDTNFEFCVDGFGTCLPSVTNAAYTTSDLIESSQFGVESSQYELCNETSLSVAKYDSFGDGWNGNEFTLYGYDKTTNATSWVPLQTVGMPDGNDGQSCLDVESGYCYRFKLSNEGSYGSEVSWEICDRMGDINTELAFCLDDNLNCYMDADAHTDHESSHETSEFLEELHEASVAPGTRGPFFLFLPLFILSYYWLPQSIFY